MNYLLLILVSLTTLHILPNNFDAHFAVYHNNLSENGPRTPFTASVTPHNYPKKISQYHYKNYQPSHKWNAAHFAQYLNIQNPHPLSTKQPYDILKKLSWYKYPGFLHYIQQLPKYETYIEFLYSNLHNAKNSKKLRNKAGFNQFAATINELYSQIKKAQFQQLEQRRKQQHKQTVQTKPNPPPHQKQIQLTFTNQQEKLADTIICSSSNSINQNYIAQRKQALADICNNSAQYKNRNYKLSKQATSFLQTQDYNPDQLSNCYGNQLQQALHTEFVDLIEQTAQLYTEIPFDQKDTITLPYTMLDFAYIGSEHNQAGYMLQALNFADFCHAIYEYGQSVVLGSCDAVKNIANMAIHPLETAYGIAYGIGVIAYHFAKICTYCGISVVTGFSTQSVQKAKKTFAEIYQPILDKAYSMSGPEIVRTLTSVAIETYLVTRAVKGVRNTCRRARNSMRRIRAAAKNIEFSELPATVLATPEGIEVEFACKGLKLAGSEMLPVLETLYRYSPALGEYVIKLETLFLELDELFNTFKHTFSEYKGVKLQGRARHIFGIELIEKKMADGVIKLKISGFHHDYLGFLENNGLITFVEKELLPNGVYKARAVINGIKTRSKTFFPKSWPPEKVIEKIAESMKNLKKPPKVEGSYTVLVGQTNETITIQTIIDTKNNRLISSYPIIKE